MPFVLSAPKDADYVQLDWHGDVSEAEMETARIQSVRFALEHGLQKLLIDVTDVSPRPSTAGLFITTLDHVENGSTVLHTALLARPDQDIDARFVRNVASNHAYPLEAFSDRAAAHRWLQTRMVRASEAVQVAQKRKSET